MLTKSKAKLEETARHGQQPPYFNQHEHQATYMYKQPEHYHLANQHSPPNNQDYYTNITRHESYEVTLTDQPNKKYTSSKNEIIKELRQQYEILKNLSIDDNIVKNGNQDKHKYSQNSSLSSSMHSNKISKVKESNVRTHKHHSKEMQSLHMQKKQLQIVISNSMRKIQQLLNNQILLKKTIHQLKNQIQGKGGISQEYEKKIKVMLRNEEDLQAQLNKAKHENQRNLAKSKELSQRIRTLQNDISSRDRQIKMNFQEQRKLHELIKLQKDKYLHLEIQCKTYKMEYDLLQKQKNNEINRLRRECESFQSGSQKQIIFMVKRLEEELKEKDKRYSELLLEINKNKNKDKDFQYPVPDKIIEKSYLQEILNRSKEISQNNSKTLADNMSIILLKMAEIQKKNDQNMKKSREVTKRKPSEYERPSNENELFILDQKVRDLQRIINIEQNEKRRLVEDVKRQKELKFQVEDKNKILERKIKELQDQNEDLQEEIRELNHTNNQTTEHTSGHHQTLRQQINTHILTINSHILTIKQYEVEKQTAQQTLERLQFEYHNKERRYEDEIKSLKRYQEEIRGLQRSNDELRFEIEKREKTGQFNLSMLKTQQQAEIKRLIFENQSVNQRIRIIQSQFNKVKSQSTRDLKIKDDEIIRFRIISEDLKTKGQEDLINQKTYYQEKITHITTTHIEQIKSFNEKFLSISASNEKLLTQISGYNGMDGQMNELRRHVRQSRSMNQGIDHLWHVKQAQYNNINDILGSIYL